MHVVIFTTIILNHYCSASLGVGKVTLNTCVMLFHVIVLIYICVEWIFPNPVLEEPEVSESVPIATEVVDSVEIASVAEESLERKNLIFWLQIEVLMFCGNIIANIIFIFLRSCSRSRIRLTLTSGNENPEDKDETDLLEE